MKKSFQASLLYCLCCNLNDIHFFLTASNKPKRCVFDTDLKKGTFSRMVIFVSGGSIQSERLVLLRSSKIWRESAR